MISKILITSKLSLITLAIYFGVSGFYKVTTGPIKNMTAANIQPKSTAVHAETEQVVQKQKPFNHYQVIITRNLFQTNSTSNNGGPNKPPPPVVTKEAELNLKLWGTFSGSTRKNYAVIEDPKERKQSLYTVGDTIQNALIKHILREKVIINVNGEDQYLALEKDKNKLSGSRNNLTSIYPRSPITPKSSSGQSQRIFLKRSQIDDATSNINQLMGEIKIWPHTKDGVADGLVVSRIKPRSIFRKMGLRNGDIITGVNGEDIRTVDDALKLYESLKSATNANVQIKRRGRERNIEYNIR